ncbi:MAG: SUKH-4 family immunity protein [Ruminococcus sp.]|nr:SUKH-4 family immunity protein [Ruminococcus sp.]
MYSDISFPNKTILEVTFLNKPDFYSISFENNNYTIVGGDKDIETNLIGIAGDGKVYYIVTDDKSLFCYIASNIRIFIKELLLFDEYINTNNLPENPDEIQLAEFADKFRSHLTELDKTVYESDFWSEVCEEMEYGII